jgi:secondary thiamine-phosphate synthase enzyme
MAVTKLSLGAHEPGLHEISSEIARVVRDSGVEEGLCTVFLQHTSASLLIQENADPTARRDLEAFFARLVPEGDPLYKHTAEGPDDMPAHVKAALLPVLLPIPIVGGHLALGTWQGIYLWEHRKRSTRRNIVVHIAETPKGSA